MMIAAVNSNMQLLRTLITICIITFNSDFPFWEEKKIPNKNFGFKVGLLLIKVYYELLQGNSRYKMVE